MTVLEYVCPESTERFVTPSLDSSFALRLMTGSYTKIEAEGACAEAGGQLVILGSEEKKRLVLNIIEGCSSKLFVFTLIGQYSTVDSRYFELG